MHRRLIRSVLLALALAGSYHVSTAARPPRFLVCVLPDGLDLFVLADSFGGIGGAVRHCVHFWNGIPRGVDD
jgi:hypothetical protein